MKLDFFPQVNAISQTGAHFFAEGLWVFSEGHKICLNQASQHLFLPAHLAQHPPRNLARRLVCSQHGRSNGFPYRQMDEKLDHLARHTKFQLAFQFSGWLGNSIKVAPNGSLPHHWIEKNAIL